MEPVSPSSSRYLHSDSPIQRSQEVLLYKERTGTGVRMNVQKDGHQSGRCWLVGFVALQPALSTQLKASPLLGVAYCNKFACH